MTIEYSDRKDLPAEDVLALYRANHWSSADKPAKLLQGLQNCHTVVSAWDGPLLVGLASALSDGCLVAYYSHVLVLPARRRQGVGRQLVQQLLQRYAGFHQQVLIADQDAQEFFQSLGFERAGSTQAMWIFDGDEH